MWPMCVGSLVWPDPIMEFATQGHLWGPMVILFPSVWGHVDTWSPPIFITEGNEVEIHMMQLADFIPRDRSTKRLGDLPKGIYRVNSRIGNRTQSPDARASSPSLDTSPKGENNILKYQIAVVFWWVSKPTSKEWEEWVLNFPWHYLFRKCSGDSKKKATYVIMKAKIFLK